MGLFGGGFQTVTQRLDPQTQAYVDYMQKLAMGYVTPGYQPGPTTGGGWAGFGGRVLGLSGAGVGGPLAPQLPANIQQAVDQYRQYAQGGNLGFSALTGNTQA